MDDDEDDAPVTVTVVAEHEGRPTKVAVVWAEGAPLRVNEVLREPTVTALRVQAPERDEWDEDEWDEDEWDEDEWDEDEWDEDEWDEDEWDENDDLAPPANIGDLAVLDLRRLAELDLSYLLLRRVGAEALAVSSSVHLDAGDGAAAEGRLETLDLRYCHVIDAGLAAITAAPMFRTVRRLHLQANRLTAAGVAALHRLPRVEVLDLRYNDIGADGAEALLAAPFVGRLTRLDLYRTDVGDVGAKLLARAPQLPPVIRSLWRSV